MSEVSSQEPQGSAARPSVSRDSLGLPIPFVEAPAGSSAGKVAAAFAAAMRLDRVGLDDDFFDLGGDSLAAEEVGVLLQDSLGCSFQPSAIAEHSTPRLLSEHLERTLEGAGLRQGPSASAHPTIFAVHGRHGYMLPKPEFFSVVGPSQPFHFFELPGLRDNTPPLETIAQLADEYLRQLFTLAPTGPIRLASFCLGAVIAMRMSNRLTDLGREHQLVLVEPSLSPTQERLYREGKWNGPARRALVTRPDLAAIQQFIRASALKATAAGNDPLADRFPGQHFSIEPRVKFFAAVETNDPRPCAGEVLVICSREREHSYKVRPSVWDEHIPRRRLLLVGETHDDVVKSPDGRTARVLVDAFEGKFSK